MDTFGPKSLKAIDAEIERLANQLSNMSPVNSDYEKIAKNLKTLTEARSMKNDSVISSEAILAAVVNIVGILVVLNFEKTGVITSKALSFLSKGKL